MRNYRVLKESSWGVGWKLFVNKEYNINDNSGYKATMKSGDIFILFADKIKNKPQRIYSLTHGKSGYHNVYQQFEGVNYEEL